MWKKGLPETTHISSALMTQLRVGRVHRLHMAGIQFGQAFDQGHKAFLGVLIVQLRLKVKSAGNASKLLQRGFDVHARASSQDGGAVV